MNNLNARLSISWGIWSIILLFTGFQAYRNVQKLSESSERVAHTHEMLEATQATLMTLTEAEAAQRGYLITGSRVELERYRTGLARLRGEIQGMRDRAPDSPRQETLVRDMETLIESRIGELQEALALNEKAPGSARQAVAAHQTRNTMGSIGGVFQAIRNDDLSLLSARQKANEHAYHVAIFSGVVSRVLGLAGLAMLLLQVIKANRDRDRVERERERERRLLRVTLRSLGDALITTDPAGAVEFMNPMAEALTGWKLGEAAGQPLEKIFQIRDELTRGPAVSPVRNLLHGGTALGLAPNAALVSRAGREVPIEDSAAPIKDDAGGVAGVALVFRDVTEKRKTQLELAQSERRFRSLTELSPNAIWVNRDDRIELVNTEGLRLMGATSADQIEGKRPLQIFHPDCHGKVLERLRRVRDGQVVRFSDETVVRLDGTLRRVEVSSASFEDTQGPAIQVVLTDVTERKQSELVLRESEERFRRLFETAPVPYALFHKNGPTLAVNQRFQETFGYDLAEIPDMLSWWRRAYPDPAALRESEQYWEAISARGTVDVSSIVLGGRRQITCKDGTVRTVEVSGLLQQDQVLATFFDLTDHLREEAERHEVEERMIQAQRLEALGVLVAGVAHNFNNILAIIMGTASMQEMSEDDPSRAAALRIIDTACQRGRGLVRSLTHFARPSVPYRVPIELGALVAELRLLLGNTAQKNISIIADLSAEPAWILGDPGSFNSSLMNICLNSLDAMPGGGTLTLRTAIPQPDTVEMTVEDTGEGMTPEILKRVTEPFFTTKAVDKGTGLGLSITYGVIKAHGGTLEITSQPGQGTQVKVRLPRHLVPAAEGTPAPVPTQPLGLAKVLVVDDEEEVRTMLVLMLTMAGADQVKAVASGHEALVSLDSGDLPDLIILDHNMPGLDGPQTLALIRLGHPDLPVVVSSGAPGLEEREVFKQKNVGVIPKPFTLAEMRAALVGLGVGGGQPGP